MAQDDRSEVDAVQASYRLSMPRIKDALRPYVLIGRRVRRDRPTINKLAWAQPPSFSQFGEDQFLMRYFESQSDGFYVDVGAYHPFNGSNTFLLSDRGWRGLNLEPAPDGLAQLRRHRPRDINLPLAVASVEGEVQFSLAGAFAGIVSDERPWGDMTAATVTVKARPLAAILDDHLPTGQTIDLLDVDCEGLDLDVLRSNDWDRYRPRLVLAEALDDETRSEITAFLARVDYRLLTRLDLTLIFERTA